MKYTFLIDTLKSGGTERVAIDVLNNLADFADENECTLLVVEKIEQINYKINERIKLVSLGIPNTPSKLIAPFRYYRWVLMLWRLVLFIWQNKPKSIVSFLLCSHWLNVASKVFAPHKAVISVHFVMSKAFLAEKTSQRAIKITKLIYSKADAIFAVSKAAMLDLKQNFGIKNAFCIYNSVDFARINELKIAPCDIQKNGFTFVTLGRLVAQKNHKMLIKAMKNLNATLWIIGGGELKSELEALIKENNLENKITLFGRLDNPYALLSKADCFVLSSFYESFGLALVEAMSCALPVIATGPAEILDPLLIDTPNDDFKVVEYGILTPNDDISSLERAMKEIITNDELRANLAKKSEQRAKDFAPQNIIKAWQELLLAQEK